MKHGSYVAWVGLVAAVLLVGCAGPRENTVYQQSAIDALMAGVYSSDVPCSSLLANGDFGIGTFENLDGEMVVLDGKIYQVKSDGHVYPSDPAVKTPFATVCRFKADKTARIETPTDYSGVKKLLDTAAPEQNLFCAVRIDGTFPCMKTRSMPVQKKPFPPLATVAASQPEFAMTNVHGTIVGFRCPPFVKGANVPGYHLHFISDDRKQGGHVLDFTVAQAECQMDLCNKYVMTLPSGNEEFMKANLDKDRVEELKRVESQKK